MPCNAAKPCVISLISTYKSASGRSWAVRQWKLWIAVLLTLKANPNLALYKYGGLEMVESFFLQSRERRFGHQLNEFPEWQPRRARHAQWQHDSKRCAQTALLKGLTVFCARMLSWLAFWQTSFTVFFCDVRDFVHSPCWDARHTSRTGPSLWKDRVSALTKNVDHEPERERRPAKDGCERDQTCPVYCFHYY